MRSRPLSDRDVERLLAACSGRHARRDRALLILLANTGLRVSEALSLNLSDIREGWVQLRAETTKGKKGRMVPLNQAAQEAVEVLSVQPPAGLEGVDRPLFRGSGGRRLGPRRVQRLLAGLGARIQIHLHPHLFRHLFLSKLARRGVPIMVIRDLAGHSSISTTNLYLHSSPDLLLEAVGRL